MHNLVSRPHTCAVCDGGVRRPALQSSTTSTLSSTLAPTMHCRGLPSSCSPLTLTHRLNHVPAALHTGHTVTLAAIVACVSPANCCSPLGQVELDTSPLIQPPKFTGPQCVIMQRTSLSSAALVVSVAVLFSQLSLSLAGSHSPTPMPTTGGLGLQDVDFTRIPIVPANETEINACCRDGDGSAGTSETLLLTPGNVGRQGACLFRTSQVWSSCMYNSRHAPVSACVICSHPAVGALMTVLGKSPLSVLCLVPLAVPSSMKAPMT